VADYPFTTLYPHLGVIRLDVGQSFVMADIPGLIEGAAEGTGLGIQFLKHLSRTKLLLHIVDIGSNQDPDLILEDIRVLEKELSAYDEELYKQDRWIVLNKTDLLSNEDVLACQQMISQCVEEGISVCSISAVTGAGCKELMYAIQKWFVSKRTDSKED